MSATIHPELVVSSWPFRLGTIVYDPELRIDVASWDLDQLIEEPDLLGVAAGLLNPLRPYRRRSDALIEALTADQELLRAVYQVGEDEDVTVAPQVSDDVERELTGWLRPFGLSIADLALKRLPDLLGTLSDWDAEDHHAFCASWWETFEQPSDAPRPSSFRAHAGPDGKLYTASFSAADALTMWRSDCRVDSLSDFSLWQALRAHWAWRLEFSSEPEPVWDLAGRVAQLFCTGR